MVFSVFCAQQIFAQDSMSPSDVFEGIEDKDKERGEPVNSPTEQTDSHKSTSTTSIKEPEVSSPNALGTKTTTQQRSITTKPPTENTKPESKQSADDSILSFNFLYYIIQKYKLQDIVD